MIFWSKVLTNRTYDGRLLRRIVVEAVRFGRGTWIGKMSVCWGQFGWKDVNMEVLKELSDVEVREVLEAITWRKDGDEAEVGDAKEDCKVGRVVGVCRVVRRADRRLMMKLSGGTTGFSYLIYDAQLDSCHKCFSHCCQSTGHQSVLLL